MSTEADSPTSHVIRGLARHYDKLVWVLTLGRERAIRERLADIAALAPGESVLDVGCGTGSLAMAAKRRVGTAGRVRGVDASPEMIAMARRKAAKAGVDVAYDVARAEELPQPDASVDVVLGTMMMHHLPRALRERFAGEVRRVLRPGGRALIVDFEPSAHGGGGLVSRAHRHVHVPLQEVVALLGAAGLRVTEHGAVGASDLKYALAIAPTAGDARTEAVATGYRTLPPVPRPIWVLPVALGVLLSLVTSLVAGGGWTALGVASLVLLALFALVVLMHSPAARGIRAHLRGRSGG